MKRWSAGGSGTRKLGTYHGLSHLGCCWPYFLIMVALGWMDTLWIALFAGIIFEEKMWWRGGIWIAKSTGIGLVIIEIMASMNNTGDSNDMHTSNLSHNYTRDGMIGMNRNAKHKRRQYNNNWKDVKYERYVISTKW